MENNQCKAMGGPAACKNQRCHARQAYINEKNLDAVRGVINRLEESIWDKDQPPALGLLANSAERAMVRGLRIPTQR